MGYLQEEHGNIIVEVVDLQKATAHDANEFKDILFQDIEAGWRNIIVDLTECEFIDSTFLGSIVMALKKINELGGKLRLVGTQPKVEAMFKLTKMNKFFEVLDTREDALDSFM